MSKDVKGMSKDNLLDMSDYFSKRILFSLPLVFSGKVLCNVFNPNSVGVAVWSGGCINQRHKPEAVLVAAVERQSAV